MSRNRPHRTERAPDGYQIPIQPPTRLNTGTLESWFTRPLKRAELDLRAEAIELGADLVAVNARLEDEGGKARDLTIPPRSSAADL